MSQLPVTVVMLNYNGWQLTKRCLESLWHRSDLPEQIVVVDNGSTDGSVHHILSVASENGMRARHVSASVPSSQDAVEAELIVVEVQENLGFARGINLGAQVALDNSPSTEAVLVLNNDTIVCDGAIQTLYRCFDDRDGVSIAAPAIFDAESGAAWSGPRRLRRWWPGTYPITEAKSAGTSGGSQAAATVTFVSGCALLVKRSCWIDLKGFDERFFFGVEDLDFSYRAGRNTAVMLFVPAAQVLHWVGSTAGDGLGRFHIGHKGLMLFMRSRSEGLLGSAGVLAYALCASGIVVFRGLRRRRPVQIWPGLVGIWSGLVAARTTIFDLRRFS